MNRATKAYRSGVLLLSIGIIGVGGLDVLESRQQRPQRLALRVDLTHFGYQVASLPCDLLKLRARAFARRRRSGFLPRLRVEKFITEIE